MSTSKSQMYNPLDSSITTDREGNNCGHFIHSGTDNNEDSIGGSISSFSSSDGSSVLSNNGG